MNINETIANAQEHLKASDVDGWLLYDYRGMNPIFWETVGPIPNVTRPCWLWVPAKGSPKLLVGFVDQGRFGHLGIEIGLFAGRKQMVERLKETLLGAPRIAMEYSPEGNLPRVSRVDAGTVELVRSLGVEVVSSGDTLQYATQRWDSRQLRSHRDAAEKLGTIVRQAFDYIGDNLSPGVTELDVAEFIRRRFGEEGLDAPDGPVVAVNEHSSDPHFDPTPEDSAAIQSGDWVLIDLWARLTGDDTMFADITWTAYPKSTEGMTMQQRNGR